MSTHIPDRWVMVEMTFEDSTYYKVLGSWYGGFMGSDSWQLSSGTVSAEFQPDYNRYCFPQVSKSKYLCHKNNYGTSMYTHGIFLNWVRVLEEKGSGKSLVILPEDTDFLNLDYK